MSADIHLSTTTDLENDIDFQDTSDNTIDLIDTENTSVRAHIELHADPNSGANINLKSNNDNTIDLKSGFGGTSNYEELLNKPQINDVVLIGNQTSADLGITLQGMGMRRVSNQELNALLR